MSFQSYLEYVYSIVISYLIDREESNWKTIFNRRRKKEDVNTTKELRRVPKYVLFVYIKSTINIKINKTIKPTSFTSPSPLFLLLLLLYSLSVWAMHLSTALSKWLFSRAAATRSLSFNCLFTACSWACVPGVIETFTLKRLGRDRKSFKRMLRPISVAILQ